MQTPIFSGLAQLLNSPFKISLYLLDFFFQMFQMGIKQEIGYLNPTFSLLSPKFQYLSFGHYIYIELKQFQETH